MDWGRGGSFQVDYLQLDITTGTSAVPEPASFALIWIGPQLLSLLLDNLELTGVLSLVEFALATFNFVVGVWFLVALGFLRGTVGPNRYGPDPVER